MWITWITGSDGIARRFALISFERCDAIAEAHQLGRSLYGSAFSFTVREVAA